jgi:hypothetical protein
LDWADILAPHWKYLTERMRACEVVLRIQETVDLNFNGQMIAELEPSPQWGDFAIFSASPRSSCCRHRRR